MTMKQTYRTYLAKKLRDLRESNSFTQTQVADKIGMKKLSYRAYEDARAEPPIFTLELICILYNISIDNLLYDSPAKNNIQLV